MTQTKATIERHSRPSSSIAPRELIIRRPKPIGAKAVRASLPADVAVRVARRAQWVAVVAGLLFGYSLAAYAADWWLPWPMSSAMSRCVAGTAAGACAAMCAAARLGRKSARRLNIGGVVFALAIAAACAVLEAAPQVGGHTPATWTPLWIVAAPLFVALDRRPLIILALAMAAFAPLALVVSAAAHDAADPPAHAYIATLIPVVFASGLSLLSAGALQVLRSDVRAARRLGNYELIEKLDTGGMGEVWRARHRVLVRDAAVKLIRSDAAITGDKARQDKMIARFRREALATASLTSPHTVEVFDFGVTGDGTLFLVMELLTGIDLDKLVTTHGALPANRAAYLLRGVCLSLADAHARGFIHRDIKPANVFACQIGEQYDFSKLFDFGLVTPLANVESDTLKVTTDNAATGTPAFMAPEMVAGTAIDSRLDLYGVGCIAYWLVTGRLVFEEEQPMEMLLAHAQRAPDPPSTYVDLPARFDALVMRCLAKDPADRPASALELAELFSSSVDTPWTNEDAHRWWLLHDPAPRIPSTLRGSTKAAPEPASIGHRS